MQSFIQKCIGKIFTTALSVIIITTFLPITSFAVFTDNSANPWTLEKADHLARRTLFAATPEQVQTLFNTGSASAAINLLFTEPDTAIMSAYEQERVSYLQGKSASSDADMQAMYAFELYRNPFEAKQKLFTLFEDIFSVDQMNDANKIITYANVRNWHTTIYNQTLGNFKDLVYQSIYSYAPTKYLDLLNANPNQPNENFARELLQLFLMEEYLPLDSTMQGSRNYSEEDVAALAKILTGFLSPNGTQITYNPNQHNKTPQLFLGELVADNAEDPAKIIDYIFAKRGNNIAQFIVWKLYKFYISENINQSQLDKFVSVFENNNFEILPVVKAMLSSPEMYSDASMNQIRYKNPLELTIGTQKLLQQMRPTALGNIVTNTPANLEYVPYHPRSIFGRPGMEKNYDWMSDFTMNQWFQIAAKFVFNSTPVWSVEEFIPQTPYFIEAIAAPATTNTTTAVEENTNTEIFTENVGTEIPAETTLTTSPEEIVNTETAIPATSIIEPINTETPLPATIIPETPTETAAPLEINTEVVPAPVIAPMPASQFIPVIETSWLNWIIPQSFAADNIQPMDLIRHLEVKLYGGRELSQVTRDQLVQYLTTDNGNPIIFLINDEAYQNTKIKGLMALILMQPEFILQSGYDQNLQQINSNNSSSQFGNKGSLVMVSLGGGADWLHVVNPYDQTYKTFRKTIALQDNEVLDLDRGYKLNDAFASLYPYYNSGELRFINNVGLTDSHSRSHSTARIQMESGKLANQGALGKAFADSGDNNVNLISLFSGTPTLFKGAKNIAIGSASTRLQTPTGLAADFLSTFVNISQTRTFPEPLASQNDNARKLDTIAQSAGTPGNQNDTQFNYVLNLMQSDIGKAYYIRANGGYDTHRNQRPGMDNNLRLLSDRMANFFKEANAKGEKLTMVVFSEFGRTNKVNGSNGTDHGNGGGMIVLSNEGTNLKIPSLTGDINLAAEANNWMKPNIDVRSVWNSLVTDIFGMPKIFSNYFGLEAYTPLAGPTVSEYRNQFLDNENVELQFTVQDAENDFSVPALTNNSKVLVSYKTKAERIFTPSTSEFINNTENNFHFKTTITLLPGQNYDIKIIVSDDKGNIQTSSFTTELAPPTLVGADGTLPNNMTSPQKLRLPENILDTPLLLSNTVITLKDEQNTNCDLQLAQQTILTNIRGTQSAEWQGIFLPPSCNFPENIMSTDGQKILAELHVGADLNNTILDLDKKARIHIPLDTNNKTLRIQFSADNIEWQDLLPSTTFFQSPLEFYTNTLGFFRVLEITDAQTTFIPVSSSNSSGGTEPVIVTPPVDTTNTSTDPNSTNNTDTSNNSSSGSTSSNTSTTMNTGSDGGVFIPTNSPSVILSTMPSNTSAYTNYSVDVSKTEGLFTRPVILEKNNIEIRVTRNTQFTQIFGEETDFIFHAAQKLSQFNKPQISIENMTELEVFYFINPFQVFNSNRTFTVNIDLSTLSFDRTNDVPKVFYFDLNTNTYKLVDNGGTLSADKKTLSFSTQYTNIWGVFY